MQDILLYYIGTFLIVEQLINIHKVAGSFLDLKVSKGELVYLLLSNRTKDLLHTLLFNNPGQHMGSVLGVDLNSQDASAIAKARRKMGFVYRDMQYVRDASIQETYLLYSQAAGISPAPEALAAHLSAFGLEMEDKLGALRYSDLYLAKLALCLAKQPLLLISETPPSISVPKKHSLYMQHIYDICLDTGLSMMTVIQSEQQAELFPGRIVTF